jgi:hypothetical protein
MNAQSDLFASLPSSSSSSSSESSQASLVAAVRTSCKALVERGFGGRTIDTSVSIPTNPRLVVIPAVERATVAPAAETQEQPAAEVGISTGAKIVNVT